MLWPGDHLGDSPGLQVDFGSPAGVGLQRRDVGLNAEGVPRRAGREGDGVCARRVAEGAQFRVDQLADRRLFSGRRVVGLSKGGGVVEAGHVGLDHIVDVDDVAVAIRGALTMSSCFRM